MSGPLVSGITLKLALVVKPATFVTSTELAPEAVALAVHE
jgi:hypothetical protein